MSFFESCMIITNVILVIIFILIMIFQVRYKPKDKLTGLPDRDAFCHLIDLKTKKKENMYVALIALDDFKVLNQELGYKNGNKFIQAISDYIVANSPKKCVARYGGDEFTVILDKNTHINIEKWLKKVFERFEEPWMIDNINYTISVSICILEVPKIADNTEDILSVLAYANSYAKKNGKETIINCDDEFKAKMNRRNRISSRLRQVVEEEKMDVYYQPIFDVQLGKYNIAEALFRLEDEELGNISPFEFFPIAEETGYVSDIGYILMDKVCKYIASLKGRVEKLPVISVNFTRQQFLYDGAVEKILSIIDKYEILPSNIAIEIPEEVFAQNYNKVAEKMREYDVAGINLFLDGFGTGFSNLHYILELPFKIIKINKNMIWEAEKNDSIFLLVSALTAVFGETGIKILASGIESESIKGIADLLFMDYLQGYYFSEPMEGDKAIEYYLREPVEDERFNDILDDVLNSIEGLDDIDI